MDYSTKETIKQLLGVRLHLAVMLSCIGLALLGQVRESDGGWLACPPTVVRLSEEPSGGKGGQAGRRRPKGGCAGVWLRPGRRVAVGRSMLLGLLWLGSRQAGPIWLIGLPGLVWLWQQSRWLWPRLSGQPEWRLLGWLLSTGLLAYGRGSGWCCWVIWGCWSKAGCEGRIWDRL